MQGLEEVSTLALVQLTQVLVFLRLKVNPEETGDLILQVRGKTRFLSFVLKTFSLDDVRRKLTLVTLGT